MASMRQKTPKTKSPQTYLGIGPALQQLVSKKKDGRRRPFEITVQAAKRADCST